MIHEHQANVQTFLGVQAIEDAKMHALACYPQESCGFIAAGVYVACENTHETPLTHFKIDDPRYRAAVIEGSLKAVVHSHPDGPAFPSHADMMQQIVTAVPWVVISLNDVAINQIVAWGDDLPIAAVISRPFLHGVLDCFSLLRDTFRLGKDGLAAQGVHWPLAPVLLPEVARQDEWWTKGDNFYADMFESFGFHEITRGEAAPGDVFLVKVGDRRANPKQLLNHAGMLLEHDQILHHLPSRPSTRQPTGAWAHAADMWIRHESSPA